MSKRRLRACLVGCGIISKAHARALSEMTDLYLCDINRAAAEALAGQFKCAGIIGSFEEAARREDIDFMDICVAHHQHLPLVREAAAHKKHILLEKPIARTVEEADAILDVVKKAGVRFFVAECWRYYQHAVKASEMIDSGAIGEVFLVRTNTANLWHPPGWRARKEPTGGGTLIDRGIHFVDLLWHLGGPIKKVYAQSAHRSILDMEGEDTALLSVTFDSGAIGDLLCSWGTHPGEALPYFSVYGTKGTIYDLDGLRLSRREGPKRADSIIVPGNIPDAEMVVETVRHFVRRMESGEPFSLDPRETRDELAVVCAAHESFESGQLVDIAGRLTA
jgi:predicted dehydrogenase